jgi:magnesium-transporting ATPase (P-type)
MSSADHSKPLLADYGAQQADDLLELSTLYGGDVLEPTTAGPGGEKKFREVRSNDPEANARQKFVSNVYTTAKYTTATFLPVFLFESFNPFINPANIYFFFIGGLQMVNSISATGGMPQQWVPLMVVLAFEAVLVVMEDTKRHNADNIENSRPAMVLDDDNCSDGNIVCPGFMSVSWKDIQVGQIVRVADDEMAPADIIVLRVASDDEAEATNTYYVETKNLDGETNLKMRTAVQLDELGPAYTGPVTTLRPVDRDSDQDIVHRRLRVECERPNTATNRFVGRVMFAANSSSVDTAAASSAAEIRNPRASPSPLGVTVSIANVMLRGTVLRNTGQVFGLVVNTGKDTKICQSSNSVNAVKYSAVEKTINSQVLPTVGLLILLCLAGGGASYLWMKHQGAGHWYLGIAPVQIDGQSAGETLVRPT